MWQLNHREAYAQKNVCFWPVVLVKTLGQQGDPTSPPKGNQPWLFTGRTGCWNWSSNTLPTWYEELTHLQRPRCWERLKVTGEGDDRRWDGWMALPTQWTWVCINSRSWWWTGRPGMLQSMGSQRVRRDWVTELMAVSLWCTAETDIAV